MTDTRGLHQQRAALAAKPAAGQHGDALLLRGQRNHIHRVVGFAILDQLRVAGIGNIGDLLDPDLLEDIVDIARPKARGRFS